MNTHHFDVNPELGELDRRLRDAFRDVPRADATSRIWRRLAARAAVRPSRWTLPSRSTILGTAAVAVAGTAVILLSAAVHSGLIHIGRTPTNKSALPLSTVAAKTVELQPMPKGSIVLRWNSSTKSATVATKVFGLTPNSQQSIAFYGGRCGTTGQRAALLTWQVGPGGDLLVQPDAIELPGGLISLGSATIHENSADSTRTPICADFSIGNTSGSAEQEAEAFLPGRDKGIASAKLELRSDESLHMNLSSFGLHADAAYSAQIHRGTCGMQGPIAGQPTGFSLDKGTTTDVLWTASSDLAHAFLAGSYLGLYRGAEMFACGDVALPTSPTPTQSPERTVAAWSEVHPRVSPSAREGAAITFDAATSQVLVFGGSVLCTADCPASPAPLADTWIWNGTTWTRAFPRQFPSPRTGAALTYDAVHRVAVLFGGSPNGQGTALGDTWLWDGLNWIQQHPTQSPPARTGASMVYYPEAGQVILFGGFQPSLTAPGMLEDTWAWNGASWIRLYPSTSPPARASASLVYDAQRHQLVLFGGSPSAANFLGDTWTWDGTTWTQQQPATSPPSRSEAATAYDADTKSVILFAGNGCTMGCLGMNNEMWAWDGVTWTRLLPIVSPSPRFSASIAYDQVRHQLVLFGGRTTDRDYDDTWTWKP